MVVLLAEESFDVEVSISSFQVDIMYENGKRRFIYFSSMLKNEEKKSFYSPLNLGINSLF